MYMGSLFSSAPVVAQEVAETQSDGIVALEGASDFYPDGVPIIRGDVITLCFQGHQYVPVQYTFVVGDATCIADARQKGLLLLAVDQTISTGQVSAWLRKTITPLQTLTIVSADEVSVYKLRVISGQLTVFWTTGLPFELWGERLGGTLVLVDGACEPFRARSSGNQPCARRGADFDVRARKSLVTVIREEGDSFCVRNCYVYVKMRTDVEPVEIPPMQGNAATRHDRVDEAANAGTIELMPASTASQLHGIPATTKPAEAPASRAGSERNLSAPRASAFTVGARERSALALLAMVQDNMAGIRGQQQQAVTEEHGSLSLSAPPQHFAVETEQPSLLLPSTHRPGKK